MPTLKTRAFIYAAKISHLKYWYFPRANDPKFYDKFHKKQRKVPGPSKSIIKKFKVSQTIFNGQKLYKISPRENKSNKVFIYIHGGAFMLPIMKAHWREIADLVARSCQTAFVPFYPLAPKATHNDIQQHITKAYNYIVKDYEPKEISVIGDSAGGSGALHLAATLNAESQPAHFILFSPATDCSFRNPRIDAMSKIDPIIPIDAVRKPLKFYHDKCGPDEPCINLLNANYSRVNHITIFNAGLDILSDDIVKLHNVLTKQKVLHEYTFEPELFHAWPVLNFCESRETRKMVAGIIR